MDAIKFVLIVIGAFGVATLAATGAVQLLCWLCKSRG